jgi:hypothetical protein
MTALSAIDSYTDLRAIGLAGQSGINEDLMQKLWDLSPTEVPGLERIGRGRTTNNVVEWLRDRLDAPAVNAWVENATYAASASSPTDFAATNAAPKNRFRNYVQSSVKAIALSDMAQLVDSAGNAGNFAKHVMDAQKELMRDIEYQVFGTNSATVLGVAASTAAKAGSLAAILDVSGSTFVANDTFAQAGSGITQGGWETSGFTFAALTGTATAAAISEADIRGVVKNLYKNGATNRDKALVALTSPDLKEVISQYMYTSTARIGSLIKESGDINSRAVSNVEFWQTDFGLLELVPDVHVSTITLTNAFSFLWLFDPSQIELVYLQGPTTSTGAKDGLVDVRWLSAHWSLRFQPEAIGGVVGVDATAAMTAS